MESLQFNALQKRVQQVIDLLGQREFGEANFKLAEASELLDEILDFSADDDDLSRYQVLLNQLQQKINAAS